MAPDTDGARGRPREPLLLGANVFKQTGPGGCRSGACQVGDRTAQLVDLFFIGRKMLLPDRLMPCAPCTQVFPIYFRREARHLRPAEGADPVGANTRA